MAGPITQLDFLKRLQDQVSEEETPEQPPVTADAIRPDMSEAEIKKKLYEMLGQSMTEQKAQVEALKAQAAKEKAYQEQIGALGKLDLRPFAQAAKGYGATNVYIPTEAPEDRTAILNKLENAVSEAQQGLTREQILALKNMMEDKRSAQAGISRRNAEARETKQVVDPLLKITAAGSNTLEDVRSIEEIITKEQIPVRQLTQIVTKFGKAMREVGTQTEGDAKRYYDPTIEARLQDVLTKFGVDGTVSRNDPSVKAMISTMKINREQAAEGISRKADDIAETYGSPGSIYAYQFQEGKPGYSAVNRAKKLSEQMLMPSKSEGESQAAPMSFEEFKKKRAEGSL